MAPTALNMNNNHRTTSNDRPFGLQEAITLYPTSREFHDPHAYLHSVRDLGERYGIIKIVSPKEWDPPIFIDDHDFKFQPRVQTMNKLNLLHRAGQNWCDRLEHYHLQKTGQRPDFAAIFSPAPATTLYMIYNELEREDALFGGWQKIADRLSSHGPGITGDRLREIYQSYVVPYKQYAELVGCQPLFETPDSFDESQPDLCPLCNREDPDMVCNACGQSYHTSPCLAPSLHLKADLHDWMCPRCLICPTEYTNETGDLISLKDYKAMGDEFRDAYIKEYMSDTPNPTGFQIEREYWKKINDPVNPLEVPYGANLKSEILGTGFPKESEGDYGDDPWNLNNIGAKSPSLFQHLRSPIPGVSSPWAYAGMIFSTFCWHSEDHFAYSVNYQHLGATKTWYGIPAKHADKFEAVCRELAPDEFNHNVDLLSDRITIVSPEILVSKGVEVYVIDQKPGDFVVTFPNAYHAGFNHGYNFNEAVNYVPPDWLPMGRLSIEYYRQIHHELAFSFDELLVLSFENEKLEWVRQIVASFLQDTLERESRLRERFLQHKRFRTIPVLPVGRRQIVKDLDDEKYYCERCKTLPFFSRLRIKIEENVPIYYCLRCALSPGFKDIGLIREYGIFQVMKEFNGEKFNLFKESVKQFLNTLQS